MIYQSVLIGLNIGAGIFFILRSIYTKNEKRYRYIKLLSLTVLSSFLLLLSTKRQEYPRDSAGLELATKLLYVVSILLIAVFVAFKNTTLSNRKKIIRIIISVLLMILAVSILFTPEYILSKISKVFVIIILATFVTTVIKLPTPHENNKIDENIRTIFLVIAAVIGIPYLSMQFSEDSVFELSLKSKIPEFAAFVLFLYQMTHIGFDALKIKKHYAFLLKETKNLKSLGEEASERINTLINSMPYACVLWEPDGSAILASNKEMIRLFLLPKEQVLDNNTAFNTILKHTPKYQKNGILSSVLFERALKITSENGKHTMRWEFVSNEGEIIPVQRIFIKIPWGDQYKIATFSVDYRSSFEIEKKYIKALRENAELNNKNKAEKAANETKIKFLANVSHEIRTPMNVILGVCDVMPFDKMDDEQLRGFNTIKKSARNLLELLDDILDISAIDTGKLKIKPTNFDFRELFDNICSMATFLSAKSSLRFFSSVDDNVPVALFGDPLRFRQIITNLVTNAIKYTEHGYVKLSVSANYEDKKCPKLIISVSDTGVGIKKEHLDSIFLAYERADSKQNIGVSGSGLGLYIVKTLVNLINGEVAVKSDYGFGSEFTVVLPLIRGDLNKIKFCHQIPGILAENANVLVVDDNIENLSVACAHLKKCGIESDTASSGKEALELITKEKYDIVFMDHMMPEMDGIEVTKIIRKLSINNDNYQIPIIALTANALEGMREEFFSAGMNDILIKPIDVRELNRVLSNWLPKEKIIGNGIAVRTKQTKDNKTKKNFTGQYIDTTRGIHNHGDDPELFYKTLRNFKKNYSSSIDEVSKLLSLKTDDDSKKALRIVHTLKSVCGLIGSEKASLALFAIEKSIKETNTCSETILTDAKVVIHAVISEIDFRFDFKDNKNNIIKPSDKLPPDKLKELLLNARLLFFRKDSSVLELVPKLTSALSEKFLDDAEKIAEFADEFDFTSAYKTIDGVLSKL